jgi:hypothetical protein
MSCPVFQNMSRVKLIVSEIRKRNISAMVHDLNSNDDIADISVDMNVDGDIASAINRFEEKGVPDSVMAFNLAKISDEERSRVFLQSATVEEKE